MKQEALPQSTLPLRVVLPHSLYREFLWQLKANRRQRITRATAGYRDLGVGGLKGLRALLAMEQMIALLVKVRSWRDEE